MNVNINVAEVIFFFNKGVFGFFLVGLSNIKNKGHKKASKNLNFVVFLFFYPK